MPGQISTHTVRILGIRDDPPMDKATVEGMAEKDGEIWAFRSSIDQIRPGEEVRVVSEKVEDEDGKYLRIHEILDPVEQGQT